MDNKIPKKYFQYLCPPGNGVYTVHTAREHKQKLHQKLYQTVDESEVIESWKTSFKEINKKNQLCLLGVTSDTGGGIQRGANWGPLFIRTKLDPSKYLDLGDTRTIPHLLHDKYLNAETIKSCREAIYGEQCSLPVSALSITEDFCHDFYKNYPSNKLVALGGDHSVSYSLVKPWLEAKKSQGVRTAVIHFDAHTDLMDKRLGIDICFGSWAYHMIELLEEPSDLIQFGIRSSGQTKQFWESKFNIQQYWADEIIKSPEAIIAQTIKSLKDKKIEEIYISFDIDALDASYASATGTPETKGLEPHTCCHYISELGKEFKVTGADLVEVAPFVRSSLESNLSPEPETTLLSSKMIINKFFEVMN